MKAIDKLNKKELRDYIITLSDSIYLIETENLKLLNSQNELSANSKILENEITLNNAEIENLKEEIENLNVLLKQSKTDMSFLQSQNEHTG